MRKNQQNEIRNCSNFLLLACRQDYQNVSMENSKDQNHQVLFLRDYQ